MFLICLPGKVVEGLVTRDCVPKESLDCWLGAVRPVERRGGILSVVVIDSDVGNT